MGSMTDDERSRLAAATTYSGSMQSRQAGSHPVRKDLSPRHRHCNSSHASTTFSELCCHPSTAFRRGACPARSLFFTAGCIDMLDASERRSRYRPDPGDTELEKLSRRRRGNPRSIPQFEHRIRDLLSGFRMALVLGSDGASKPKWRARPDLPRLRPRNDRGHHGRGLHAYHRPDAGRAAPCRRRPAARLHGDRSSAGHGNADACDVRRIRAAMARRTSTRARNGTET